MSEATAKPVPFHQIALMEVRISGKLLHSRRANQQYYTQLRTPAPDEWSHPSTVEVRSKDKLGETDDVLNLRCRLSGSVRSFQYTDRDTGERKTGFDSKVFLDVVE